MLLNVLGYEKPTIVSAGGLTVPAGTQVVLMQATSQTVRWRDDGTDPTTSAGMRIVVDRAPCVYHGNPKAFKAIAETSGGVLLVSYYG